MRNIKLKMEKAFKCTPLLLFLFTVSILSQSQIPQGNGYSFSFRLYYGTPGDSIKYIHLDMQYGDLAEIWIDTSSNSPGDSVGLYSGAIGFSDYDNPNDTIWGGLCALRDSSMSVVNVAVSGSSEWGKHYFISEPIMDLLEVKLLNARANLITRSIKGIIKIKKSTVTQ